MKIPLVLVGAALVFNIGLLILCYVPSPKHLVGDEGYYFHLASDIAAGRLAPHDPLWPPLYGEAMGALFRLLGVHILAVQVIQIVLWLATALAFFRIASRLCPSTSVPLIALGLFLLTPELAAFSHYLWPETVHLFLLVFGIWLLVEYQGAPWAAAASGSLFALALCMKSLLLPFIPIVVLFILLLPGAGTAWRKRIIATGLFVTATVLTLAAAGLAIRGAPVVSLSGSSIFNLWVGLNDTAKVDFRNSIAADEHTAFLRSGPDLAARNTVYREKIRRKIGEDGVMRTLAVQAGTQYFRLFDYHSFFTTQLPGSVRLGYTFDSAALAALLSVHSALMHAIILAAGAFGMSFLRARPAGWTHFFLLFIVYNLALFLPLHVVTRYLIQFLPMWIFFAAVALGAGLERFRRKETPIPACFVFTKARVVVGCGLGLLMVALSFRSLLFGP